jgi:gamma-glutamylcyclotransferase (GGCT)/AIG2-like uncharacterized protein YtfP
VADPDLIFVYGTLRRASGHRAHARLARAAEPVGEGSVAGRLYLVADYPGLVATQGETRRVRGEVYRLRVPSTLADLDRYEGCDPVERARGLYRRERADVVLDDGRRVAAWVYLYNRPVAALRPIASGDYCSGEP